MVRTTPMNHSIVVRKEKIMTINKGRYLLRTVRSEAVNELEKLGELIKVDDTYFYLLKSNCSISDIVKIKMVDIIDANGYKLTTS